MLLDQIVEENAVAAGSTRPPPARSERFLGHLPFRGLLADVRGLSGTALQDKAELGWKVHTMPVGVIGARETRKADGYQALVRGGDGALLSITSASFKPHQNPEILAGLQSIATAGDAEILYAGALDGGRKVAAIARLNGVFTMPDLRTPQQVALGGHAGPVDDTVELYVVLSGGHEVGTPYKLRGMAFRLWCANGAFFTKYALSTYAVTHRQALAGHLDEIRKAYQRIQDEFTDYAEIARRLALTEANQDQQRLFVAELLKPGIVQEVRTRFIAGLGDDPPDFDIYQAVGDSLRGQRALNEILLANESEPGFARTGATLLDAIVAQQGANGSNLWTAYNGVTHHVNHVRGRSDATGVDAALFGAGATLTERALATAEKFAVAA